MRIDPWKYKPGGEVKPPPGWSRAKHEWNSDAMGSLSGSQKKYPSAAELNPYDIYSPKFWQRNPRTEKGVDDGSYYQDNMGPEQLMHQYNGPSMKKGGLVLKRKK